MKSLVYLFAVILCTLSLTGQQNVDAHLTRERIISVVSIVGSGGRHWHHQCEASSHVIARSSIAVAAFLNEIHLQWPASPDNLGGIGRLVYPISRIKAAWLPYDAFA